MRNRHKLPLLVRRQKQAIQGLIDRLQAKQDINK